MFSIISPTCHVKIVLKDHFHFISKFVGAIIACEQNDAEALRVVIDKNQFDVTSAVNGNYELYPTKWSLLDIAINLNNVKCALLLQERGAIESFQCKSKNSCVFEK